MLAVSVLWTVPSTVNLVPGKTASYDRTATDEKCGNEDKGEACGSFRRFILCKAGDSRLADIRARLGNEIPVFLNSPPIQ